MRKLNLLSNDIKAITQEEIELVNRVYDFSATNNIINKYVTHYWVRDAENRNFIVFENDEGVFELLDGYCLLNQNANARSIKCYHGAVHSLEAPAVITTDSEEWYKMGKRHREDGPAICDGHKRYKLWYLDGQSMSLEEFWDNQKNTEHASKIVANQYGKKENS